MVLIRSNINILYWPSLSHFFLINTPIQDWKLDFMNSIEMLSSKKYSQVLQLWIIWYVVLQFLVSIGMCRERNLEVVAVLVGMLVYWMSQLLIEKTCLFTRLSVSIFLL